MVCAVLVGCWAMPRSSPSDRAATAVDLPVSDVNPFPRAELSDGGEVRIALTGAATHEWNPLHRDTALTDVPRALEPVAPRFWLVDALGQTAPDPSFLSSAEELNTDPTEVLLRLNPDAVWADGSPITWLDVQAPLVACADPANPCTDSIGPQRIVEISRGADDHEVLIRFDRAYPQWREVVVAPVRAEVLSEGFDWTEPDLRAQAGPFVVESWDAATGVLTQQRNPLWWGTPALLERLRFRWLAEPMQAAAFVNNEIDVFSARLDAEAAERVRGVTDGAIRVAAGTDRRTIVFHQQGPLADPALRQGLAMAVDREAIRDQDVTDPTKAPVLLNRFLSPSSTNHRDNTDALGGLGDVGAASTRLAYAAPELEFLWSSDDPAGQRDGELLQAQWAEIGINLTLVEVDAAEYRHRLRTGNFQVTAATLPSRIRPELWFHSDSALNLSGVVDPQLDTWLGEIGAAPHWEPDVANQVDRWLWAEAVSLPLYLVPEVVGIRSGLANLGAGPGSITWEQVGFRH